MDVVHDVQFYCRLCSKGFVSAGSRNDHERNIHQKLRPFKCEECGKRFYKMFNLKVHEQKHLSEYSHSCTVCSKTFKSAGSVKVHMKCHTNERTFMCEVCGKAFKTRAVLEAHLNTHTHQIEFSCAICDKVYPYRSSLFLHMRSHTGEKPYRCNECNATFTVTSHLADHMITHAQEKSYECTLCHTYFTRLRSLKKHLQAHMLAGLKFDMEKILQQAKLQVKEKRQRTSDLGSQSPVGLSNIHPVCNDTSSIISEVKALLNTKGRACLDPIVSTKVDELVTITLSAIGNPDKNDMHDIIEKNLQASKGKCVKDNSQGVHISDIVKNRGKSSLTLLIINAPSEAMQLSGESCASPSDVDDSRVFRDQVDHHNPSKYLHEENAASSTYSEAELSSSRNVSDMNVSNATKDFAKYNKLERLAAEVLHQSSFVENKCLGNKCKFNMVKAKGTQHLHILNHSNTCTPQAAKEGVYGCISSKNLPSLRSGKETGSHQGDYNPQEIISTSRAISAPTAAGSNSIPADEDHPFSREVSHAGLLQKHDLEQRRKLHYFKYKYVCKTCNQAFKRKKHFSTHECVLNNSSGAFGGEYPSVNCNAEHTPGRSYSHSVAQAKWSIPGFAYNTKNIGSTIRNSHESDSNRVYTSDHTDPSEKKFRGNLIIGSSIAPSISDLGSCKRGVLSTTTGSVQTHTETNEGDLTIITDKKTRGKTKCVESGAKRSPILLTCSYCAKQFRFRSELKLHERIHTGEKPFPCPLCERSFSKKSNMEAHRRAHAAKQSYLCDLCGKNFSYQNGLTAHKQLHFNACPYVCKVCGKGFRYECNLVVHRKRHAGVFAFRCVFCSKSFVTKVEMQDHRSTHTGDKPYSCEFCSQRFAYRHNVVNHRKIHSDQSYVCKVCNMSFMQFEMFVAHSKKHLADK